MQRTTENAAHSLLDQGDGAMEEAVVHLLQMGLLADAGCGSWAWWSSTNIDEVAPAGLGG
ncbi:hypothetical protein ACLOJK_004768 [Asimina triloba]